ncbi:polymorphic toxin type 44 domain-containing protein [Aerosakkonema sp. BLCC-F183]|uniref:polymorphic toxin type 44 domain-containing protein n=1 Tax=Aerosakkonema sp. BLCC-F183 TaxID=3342834 RepID=UPI0035B7542F
MFELSKAFDAGYYSMTNPDLTAAGLVNPEQLFNHFFQFGTKEGRSFSPYVDLNFYGGANPDLAAGGVTTPKQLLDHLITYGINEKRLFSPKVDLNFYAAANQDLGAAGLTTGEQLLDHLINYGAREGRQLVFPASPPPEILFPAPPQIPNLPLLGLAEISGSRLLNNQINSNLEKDVNLILSTSLKTAIGQMENFVTEPDFSKKLTIAFEKNLNLESAKSLIQDLASGKLLPEIKIVPLKDINGYNGAFDALTNTIYISKEFLQVNANNPDQIASVLLEEIGHSVDSRVNAIDALGDEGEIFSALVRGVKLSQADLLTLKSENDQVIISPNGQPILVETSSSAWTATFWDWNWNKLGDTTFSKRIDGSNGVDVTWGSNSVMGRSDYFVAGMWNSSYFDANKTYKFRVNADDGFLLYVSPDGKNWNFLSSPNQWEYAYERNDNYKTFKQYSFTPSNSGNYYVYAFVFEKQGDAYFDLSWDNGWDKNRGGLNYADGDTTLQYMYEEIKNNASSDYAKNINNLNKNWWSSWSAKNEWYKKVNDGQEWDHKPKLDSLLNLKGSNDYFYPVWGNSNREFYYDIWSNIHYGYVGKAAGFSDSDLQNYAWWNDLGKLNFDFNDSKAVKLGIELWNETGGNPNNLTPEKLRQKVISQASSLNGTDNIVNGA